MTILKAICCVSQKPATTLRMELYWKVLQHFPNAFELRPGKFVSGIGVHRDVEHDDGTKDMKKKTTRHSLANQENYISFFTKVILPCLRAF